MFQADLAVRCDFGGPCQRIKGWAGDTMQTLGGMDRATATRVARRKMLERSMGLRRNKVWMHPWQLAVCLVQLGTGRT